MGAPQTEHWTARLSQALGVPSPAVPDRAEPECIMWAQTGAMSVTGRAEGPPLLSPGSPSRWAQHALDVISACSGREVASTRLLGERAQIMRLVRRSPLSAGGACRLLRTMDGLFAISLARPADHELVPALVQRPVLRSDPWPEVESWLLTQKSADAESRTALLGMAATAVPVRARLDRPPVVVTPGGRRQPSVNAPLVVDLSALWAGPLCAHLLHRAGADVVTVESRSRPDGARRGSPEFYARLHQGHQSIVLDFDSQLAELTDLLRRADVVIEGSRPRALARLGIDADSYVSAGTIWVSVTAYGRTDDAGLRIGFGDDVAAGAGFVSFDGQSPCFVGDALADPLTGVSAAAAVSLALGSSSGCLLDVSMHHVAQAAAELVPDHSGRVIETQEGWTVVCGDRQAAVI